MRTSRRFLLNLLCAVALIVHGVPFVLPAIAAGTVSLTAFGTAYTQDFNTLASSGTSSVVPTGWDFVETGTNANALYAAGTGSNNAGDTYSFGAASNAERAFGGLRSGTLVPLIGAQFTNNAGGTITSLSISYTGEQWRLGQNTTGRAADRLDFQLSTNATSLSTGTWTDYDALDFSSPVVAGTNGALNGNVAPNRTPLSFAITGLSIPNGASFWIRWADSDLIPGSDDGLSVDDFSLTPSGIIVPEVAPEVASTDPLNGAADVAVNASITVGFSEAVDVGGAWYSLVCSVSGSKTSVVTGGPVTFTINPNADLTAGESCTLTIYAAQVTDQDTKDPPDNMAVDYSITFTAFDVCAQTFTPIYDIQGSGPTTTMTGTVTTQGVVVGDYEAPPSGSTQIRGFYVQDLTGDGDEATSDGIFVYNDGLNSISLGDVVRVTGWAQEYQGQTEVEASTIIKCSTGSVDPVDVTLPFSTLDFPEQYEGMLVSLPQTLYVTEHYQLGRFGEVLLSSGDRLWQPTHLALPGYDAGVLQAANNLNQILLDDGNNLQNEDPIVFGRGGLPLSASNTLRGGDTATGIVGVLTYSWGGNSASPNAYRVRPSNALGGSVNFVEANSRPSTAPDVGGTVRVAGMNLLNFFNTFGSACTLGVGGGTTDCRGADDADEFARQWPKTVAAIAGTGADIVGVIEMENDGYGADSAIQFLVDQLNADTAPGTYAFIDVDAATGQVNALGVDAIKVGLIYKPANVIPVGQTAALNTVGFVNGGDSGARNRPALAQAFEQVGTGGRFVVSVNHLKSKGSACDDPDAGDGQGNCNIVRTIAAVELTAWLASDPTGTGDPDALIIGDLNSYAKEDPIAAIQQAGYDNLIYDWVADEAYSYVFDGQWGYLDHALGSASLAAQVAGVAEWHISADEPSVLDYNDDFKSAGQLTSLYADDEFRISDHDPVIAGLELVNYPPELGDITAPADPVLIGTPVNVSVPFTDPDALDTHTATWTWGDGSTSAGIVTENMGAGTTTGQHIYTTPGLYTIQVTVQDNFGHSDQASYLYVVVYDPNGGFVTGGGWFSSPAGAYTLDPALTGKATFGFNCKYQKGATVPKGNTEFQLHGASFNFKATSFQWLVVAGDRAQYKGSGTINGAGDYGFILTAIDGQGKGSVDKLRIKIWDKATGTVIYDNQMGAPDDAVPTMAVDSGSIVIHK